MNRPVQVVVLLFCFVAGSCDSADTTVVAPDYPNAAAAIPDIPFIPTPNDVVDRMLELACIEKRDIVYDLGCGDGRILVEAAKKYGCRCVGCDIDPRRIGQSKENVKRAHVEDLVKVEQQDMFEVDLRQACVVFLYLSPRANVRLLPQLEKLPPGSRIISHQFGIRGIKPDKIVEVDSKEDHHKHKLFLWRTPLEQRTATNRKSP
jgi:SAM-dependent methyltransferase